MEIVDVKSLRGLAKIAGTVVSFAGVTTMTLYKGAAITSLWKSLVHIPGSDSGGVAHGSWVKGSVLAVASCICWSIWYIMQVFNFNLCQTVIMSHTETNRQSVLRIIKLLILEINITLVLKIKLTYGLLVYASHSILVHA